MKKILSIVIFSLLLIGFANASKSSWKKHWDPYVGMTIDEFYTMWLDASGIVGWDPYAWEVKTTNSWLKPIYPNQEGLDGKTPFAWLNYEKYISDTLIIKIQAEPQIYYFKGSNYKLFKIDTGQYMMAKRKEEIDIKNAELAEKKKQDKLRAQIETETMKENEIAQKKIRIQNLKSDCAELGFTDGTEAMGNCVLKLMELEGKNTNQTTVVSTPAEQGLTEYEKKKLEIEEAYLKAEQERIRIQEEKNREELRQRAAENLFNWGQELGNPKQPTRMHCTSGRGWNSNNQTCTYY